MTVRSPFMSSVAADGVVRERRASIRVPREPIGGLDAGSAPRAGSAVRHAAAPRAGSDPQFFRITNQGSGKEDPTVSWRARMGEPARCVRGQARQLSHDPVPLRDSFLSTPSVGNPEGPCPEPVRARNPSVPATLRARNPDRARRNPSVPVGSRAPRSGTLPPGQARLTLHRSRPYTLRDVDAPGAFVRTARSRASEGWKHPATRGRAAWPDGEDRAHFR